MKILLPLLLLLPYLVLSQSIKVDSVILGNTKFVGDKVYRWVAPKPKLYGLPEVPKNLGIVTGDSIPITNGGITTNAVQYYTGTRWYDNTTTELVKGKIETPINVMDSGMKVEVVETRDTIYKCPYSNIIYYTYDYNVNTSKDLRGCAVDKIVTTRRYKLYVINEYGQKEYLSMEITKTK